jgi:hypothetical protein
MWLKTKPNWALATTRLPERSSGSSSPRFSRHSAGPMVTRAFEPPTANEVAAIGRLRTTNPIESTYETVRHRTIRSRGCLWTKTALARIFKLAQAAEKG